MYTRIMDASYAEKPIDLFIYRNLVNQIHIMNYPQNGTYK